MPGTVLGAGDTVVNKTDTDPVAMSLEGKIQNKVQRALKREKQ